MNKTLAEMPMSIQRDTSLVLTFLYASISDMNLYGQKT